MERVVISAFDDTATLHKFSAYIEYNIQLHQE